MALTKTQYLNILYAQLNPHGLADWDKALRANTVLFWDLYAEQGGLRGQFLYTKLAAIDMLMAGNWTKVQTKEGDVEKHWEQLLENLQRLRDNTVKDIVVMRGALETTTPISTLASPTYVASQGGEFG